MNNNYAFVVFQDSISVEWCGIRDQDRRRTTILTKKTKHTKCRSASTGKK